MEGVLARLSIDVTTNLENLDRHSRGTICAFQNSFVHVTKFTYAYGNKNRTREVKDRMWTRKRHELIQSRLIVSSLISVPFNHHHKGPADCVSNSKFSTRISWKRTPASVNITGVWLIP